MLNLTERAIRAVAPKAHPVIVKQIVENLQGWAPAFGLDSDEDVLEFIVQLVHESAGLTKFEESLYYKTGERIKATWPKRFINSASAQPYAKNPQKLANRVYANRMGNGDEASGDGFRYRGRSGLQATGKDMYAKISVVLKFDFVSNPDALADPKWVLPASLAIAKLLKLGELTGMDADTRRLNGGTIGLADRKAIYAKLKRMT